MRDVTHIKGAHMRDKKTGRLIGWTNTAYYYRAANALVRMPHDGTPPEDLNGPVVIVQPAVRKPSKKRRRRDVEK